MLAVSLAPFAGVEFQSTPFHSSRLHKRAEVSTTLRAPWDINWDNIIDNVRLACFTHLDIGRSVHQVGVHYDKKANRWNFLDASIKADVLNAGDVAIGYELKRTFADKLTSLRLRLSSPELAGCKLVTEVDTLQRKLHSVTPSVDLSLGKRLSLHGKTDWRVGAKAMKHVGRLQLLTRTFVDRNEIGEETEVGALPLELRATVSHKLGQDDSDLDLEIALEQELGYLKGVGAKFDAGAKELVVETWHSREGDDGLFPTRVMTAEVAFPYEGRSLKFDEPTIRLKRSHIAF